MDTNTLLNILLWGLGGCITGFIFLVSWIIKLSVEMKDRVTFEWAEDQLKHDIKIDVTNLRDDFEKMDLKISNQINEIKEAILGTVDKRGILNKIHEHDDRLRFLEKV